MKEFTLQIIFEFLKEHKYRNKFIFLSLLQDYLYFCKALKDPAHVFASDDESASISFV